MTKRVTKFSEQKAKGDKLEQEVLAIVLEKNPKAYIVEGADKEKDIVIPEKNIKVECSDNPESLVNVFIEVHKGEGYPSKLTSTTADLWAIGTPHSIYITTPKMLRDYIEKHKLDKVRSVDGNLGYSIPADDLPAIVTRKRNG